MENIIILGLVMVAIVIFMGVKFFHFKTKLMNEFGRQGVPFYEADKIYMNYRSSIHSMSNDGLPISEVVKRHINENGAAAAFSTHHGIKFKGTEEGKLSDIGKSVVEMVVNSISLELKLISKQFIDAHDEFATGYVIGFTDAATQKSHIGSNSTEGLSILTTTCIILIGRDAGPEIVARFIKTQGNHPREFLEGRNAGGLRLFDLLNGDAEYSLVKHHLAKKIQK